MDQEGIKIDPGTLSKDALDGIIKDFVLRDGTDYGDVEYSLQEKIEQVKVQLNKGHAAVYFDLESETCTIALTNDLE